MWSFFSRPAAAELIEAVGRVLDGLFTSDKERLSKTAALARVAQQPALVQAEINKIEAAHRSVFVSGWRPFIGWSCGVALAWSYVVTPILHFGLAQAGLLVDLPAMDMSEMMPVLMGMLGLGGLRTFEKFKGVTK